MSELKYSNHFWRMCLCLNIGAPKVKYSVYNTDIPASFDYFSKHGFSTIGACAIKHDYMVNSAKQRSLTMK